MNYKNSARPAINSMTKMNPVSFILSIILFPLSISAFGSPAIATPAHAAQEKYSDSMRLVQHSRLIGEEILWLTPLGLRLENPRSHIVFVSHAPDWIVYKFSLETRKYISFPSSAIVNRITGARAMFGGTVLHGATCAKSGSESLLGFDLDKFLSDKAFQKRAADMFATSMVRSSFPKSFVYRTFPANWFPPQEAHILSLLRGLPDVHGVPVDLSCDPFEGQKYMYLSATEIQQTSIPEAKLRLPAGFLRVQTDMDITYDDKTRKDMFDFLEGSDKRGKGQ